MYELTGNHLWLQVAIETAHDLLDQYWDSEHGGLFTESRDGEQLIDSQKDIMDNATASANSVAAMALMRLGALCDEPIFHEKAYEILLLLARVVPSAPSAFGNALSVFLMEHNGISEVVLPGQRSEFIEVYREQWRPDSVLAWGNPTGSSLWEDRQEGFAYVCRQRTCQLPTSHPEEFRKLLATT
jgi:uncharacterized protein YyaL (SSP411 family)